MKKNNPMKRKIEIWTSAKADIEMSHFVRDRDKGKCFFCGKEGSQNSHFWGRNTSATRYLEDNCDYVCGGCHMRHEANKQGIYREMKIKQLGQERYDELKKIYYQSKMSRREAVIACMELLAQYQIKEVR